MKSCEQDISNYLSRALKLGEFIRNDEKVTRLNLKKEKKSDLKKKKKKQKQINFIRVMTLPTLQFCMDKPLVGGIVFTNSFLVSGLWLNFK